jgi:hypothetical protein
LATGLAVFVAMLVLSSLLAVANSLIILGI